MPAHKPILVKLPLSDTSSPQSKSTGSTSRCSTSSSGVESTCRTGSVGSSWITCSEKSVSHYKTAAAGPMRPPSKTSLSEHRDHVKLRGKSKILDMLSAVDRRRKQALPQVKSEDLYLTQDPFAETATPARTFSTALHFTRMQPRGPSEREDYSELCDFLNAERVKPEDIANMHAPKSGFDWDDDSDGDLSPQLRHSHLRALQRVTRRWQAAGLGDSSRAKHSKGIFGTGLSVDDWMKHAKDYAEGQRGEAEATVKSPVNRQLTGSDSNTGSPTGLASRAMRRRSVLKLFNDPVWSNDDVSSIIAPSFRDDRNASVKDLDENQDLALVPAATSSTMLDTQVGSNQFLNAEVNQSGFRQVNWSRHGRGISAIIAPECKPKAARVLGAYDLQLSPANNASPEKQLLHKSSKSSMLKKLRSQVFETTSAAKIAELDHAPPQSVNSPRIPNFAKALQRRLSLEEVRGGNIDDPFTDGVSRSASVRTSGYSGRFSLDGRSPKKDEEQWVYLPELRSYQYRQKLQTSPSKSSPTNSFYAQKYQFGGYPKGPEHPNWDDTIRRVRKIVEAREKREAEEARQQQKESRKEEKKLKRLKAGKDVVIRGSQLGLALRKPIHEMTEDEFEAFGALATSPREDTPTSKKTNVFSALFTKIVGSANEKEDYAAQTKRLLDRHRSLEVLNSSTLQDMTPSSADEHFDYEKALRALINDDRDGGGPTLHLPGGSRYSPSDSTRRNQNEDTSGMLHVDGTVSTFSNSTFIGLGITTSSESCSLERNKATAGMNYQEFLALKRSRPNPVVKGDSRDQLCDGLPLSNIPEEDVEYQTYATIAKPGASPAANGGSTKPITAKIWREETKSVHRPSDPFAANRSVGTLSWPSSNADTSEEDGYDDGSSWCTIDEIEDAAASDFSAFQARTKSLEDAQDDDESDYSDDVHSDAMPRPLNIRVLKVKRSSAHVQPPDSNSFIPDRKASFHARIQEVSRLQVAHIGSSSHPALRGASEGLEDKTEFFSEARPRTPSSKQSGETPKQQHWEGGSTVDDNIDPGEDVGGVDLNALRATIGLAPAKLASSTSSAKHPNHPFTWIHEKVMCRQIHNPIEVLPTLPQSANDSMDVLEQSYLQSSGTSAKTKKCDSCGAFCCRFANLLVLSKINSGGDIMEEMVRSKAQQRVEMLRTYHPNGIEEYETFLECAQCGRLVCPRCAKKCREGLCQSVVCTDCRGMSEVCPVGHGS